MSRPAPAHLAVSDLRYVSLTAIARETGRRPGFWLSHWHQVPGAETYPSGHRRAFRHSVGLFQQQHRQQDCPVCGDSEAKAEVGR